MGGGPRSRLLSANASTLTGELRIAAAGPLREPLFFVPSQLERELIRELQLALNETCNSYHDAGHAQRVKATFGLVMEGGL